MGGASSSVSAVGAAAEGAGHENAEDEDEDAAGFVASDFDMLPKPKPTGFPPKPPLPPPPNAKPPLGPPTPNREADGGGGLSVFSVDREAETLPPNSGVDLVVFSGEVVTPNRGIDDEALSPPLDEAVAPKGLTKGLSSAWKPSLVSDFERPESPNGLPPLVLDPKRLLPKTEGVEEEPNADPVREEGVDSIDSVALLKFDKPEVLLAGGGKEKTDFVEEPPSVDLLESNLKPPPLEEVVEVEAAGGPNPEKVVGGAGIEGGTFTTASEDDVGGVAKEKELPEVEEPLVELLGLGSVIEVDREFLS